MEVYHLEMADCHERRLGFQLLSAMESVVFLSNVSFSGFTGTPEFTFRFEKWIEQNSKNKHDDDHSKEQGNNKE